MWGIDQLVSGGKSLYRQPLHHSMWPQFAASLQFHELWTLTHHPWSCLTSQMLFSSCVGISVAAEAGIFGASNLVSDPWAGFLAIILRRQRRGCFLSRFGVLHPLDLTISRVRESLVVASIRVTILNAVCKTTAYQRDVCSTMSRRG